MDWQDEPATWKQLRYLRQNGYKADRHLSKTAAAELDCQYGWPDRLTAGSPRRNPSANPLPKMHTCLGWQSRRLPEPARMHDGIIYKTAQQDIALAISKRQMFWIDTCRDPTRNAGRLRASPRLLQKVRLPF
jgi:hypothetical protein